MNDKPLIHGNHNVYILGAGFSHDAGLPLMNGFFYQMRDAADWLDAQEDRGLEVKSIGEVLKFRLKAASAAYRMRFELENIEQLFSLASASENADSSGGIAINDLTTAIAATIDYAKQTGPAPKHTVLYNHQDYPAPPEWEKQDNGNKEYEYYTVPIYDLYAGLISAAWCKQVPGMRKTVITFNYDTLLEESLSRLGIDFTYGLKEKENKEIFDHTTPKFKLVDNEQALPILKLHGSVNWGTPCQESSALHIFDDYTALRQTGNLYPVLIPPTWRKVFGGAINQVWEKTRLALSQAARIIIIGFSMPLTDIHFRYLLASGLQENISLQDFIVINYVDPSSNSKEQIIEDYKKNFDQIFQPFFYNRIDWDWKGTSDFFLQNRWRLRVARDFDPDRVRKTLAG